MSDNAKNSSLSNKRLLPWQMNFANDFLHDKNSRYWELVAPNGAGKSHLASVLVAEWLRNKKRKRVLILAPAPVIRAWQYNLASLLQEYKLNTLLMVDWKEFLEFEMHAPKDFWPSSAIVLMSIDLAKRDRIAQKIIATNWELVIIDESQRLTGMRRDLVQELMESEAVNRGLFLTAKPHLHLKEMRSVEIKYKDLVGWDGRSLLDSVKIEQIRYKRSKEECAFLGNLQQFSDSLSKKWPDGQNQTRIIQWAAASSAFTAEAMLYRLYNFWKTLRNKIAHNIDWTEDDIDAIEKQLKLTIEEPSILNEIAKLPQRRFQPHEFLAYYNELERLLNQVEDIPSDSKMDCLIAYLRNSKCEKKRSVCIVTAFALSVQYIGASLQNARNRTYSLTGTMSSAQRANTLAAFRKEGGFLVATDASLEGISLENVETCINFELPASADAFEQRIGRFVRFGREKKITIVLLTDESGASSWEETRLVEYTQKFRLHSREIQQGS